MGVTASEAQIRMGEIVESAQANATGTLVNARPTRVRGVHLESTGTAGSAVFRDGGGGGATKIVFDTPASAGMIYIPVPGGGVKFDTDVHVTLTNVDGVTIFYA